MAERDRTESGIGRIAIVGGGPACLVAAIALARRGISTTVLERDAHPELAPRFSPDRSYTIDITGHGLRALQFAREAVQRALDVPLHDGLRTEADLSTLAYRTRDAEEGMQAFVEKRKPQFRDE